MCSLGILEASNVCSNPRNEVAPAIAPDCASDVDIATSAKAGEQMRTKRKTIIKKKDDLFIIFINLLPPQRNDILKIGIKKLGRRFPG
jgi:hypothetical protein